MRDVIHHLFGRANGSYYVIDKASVIMYEITAGIARIVPHCLA